MSSVQPLPMLSSASMSGSSSSLVWPGLETSVSLSRQNSGSLVRKVRDLFLLLLLSLVAGVGLGDGGGRVDL